MRSGGARRVCLCGLALGAAVVALPAAVSANSSLIHVRIVDHTYSRPQSYSAKAAVTGSGVRIDTPPPGGRPDTIIYVASQKVIRHADHSAGSFVEYDTRLIGGAGEVARSVRGWFEDAIASVRNRAPAGSPFHTKRTDVTQTISGLSCRKYLVYRDAAVLQEVWAVPWSAVGFKADQVRRLKELARYYENLEATMHGTAMSSALPEIVLGGIVNLDGYPLVIRQFRGKRLSYAISLSRPSPLAADGVEFRLPDSYRRAWLPLGGGEGE